MVATSLDLSQIKTDALSSASTFRTLIGLGSTDTPTFKTLVISDGSASSPAIDIAQTWNNGVAKFTAFKLDVTDTASNASSLLMDLQVGGTSKFSVTKTGDLSCETVTTDEVILDTSTKITSSFNVLMEFVTGGGTAFKATQNGITLNGSSGQQLSFGSSYPAIIPEASHTLAFRNSTNPQTFRIYNTYTNASNYERGFLKWDSNIFKIGVEADGTGATRQLEAYSGIMRLVLNGASNGWGIYQSSFPIISGGTGGGTMYGNWGVSSGITGSSSSSSFGITTTWNTTGTPTGLKLNVTDTASDASSLLMDLQVGGSSKFSVDKNGNLRLPNNTDSFQTNVGGLWFGDWNISARSGTTQGITFRSSQSAECPGIGADHFALKTTDYIGWSIDGNVWQTKNLRLYSDGSNVLAQRNSTNPQTFRIYNIYTDASNYERADIGWSGNVFEIAPYAAGTGVARTIRIGQTGVSVPSTQHVQIRGYAISLAPRSGAIGISIDQNANITVGQGDKTFTLHSSLVLTGASIVGNTTTGTKIGTATTQKLGFFNATPVVQPTAVADATDAASVITQLNALLSRVRDLGLIAT